MNEWGFVPGQILYKKRKKAGRAFRSLMVDIMEAAALNNIVELQNEDILVFIDVIEDACIGQLTMPMAKVLSPHGIVFIQPSRLVSEENRQREDVLGY